MLGDGKSVVLSFDDGPAPVSALESILETLRLNEIKAEFYVLGSEVEQYPDAARMIVREGHGIQNHSWSHPDLSRATAQNVRLELKDTQAVIADDTGVIPTKVCREGGAIKRGDLIVSSSQPGVAMKADPDKVRVGQVLGKALQDFNQAGVGKINVLVSIK